MSPNNTFISIFLTVGDHAPIFRCGSISSIGPWLSVTLKLWKHKLTLSLKGYVDGNTNENNNENTKIIDKIIEQDHRTSIKHQWKDNWNSSWENINIQDSKKIFK